jgi:preprotein translocase subunit SecG
VSFKRSLGSAVLGGGAEPVFSPAAKSAAMATVVLWLAIIFLGRAIAYDVEVWGALSLSPRA